LQADRGSVFFSARVLVVLMALLPPFWLRAVLTPAGEPVNQLVRRWSRRALRWSGCRVTVSGLEHLDGAPCSLLVANHSSIIDSVVLIASVPASFRFVVNHMAASRPFIGPAIRRAGYLTVNRGSAASRAACGRAMIEALEAGTSLMVFPEGTRAEAGLLPFQLGAFRVALAAGRPIVPIAVSGTGQVLPRRLRLLRRAPIAVTILPPVACPSGTTALELRDQVAGVIATQIAASRA
jgi:1-acyl-sn-glycerol-3-phosphate acyltransferase